MFESSKPFDNEGGFGEGIFYNKKGSIFIGMNNPKDIKNKNNIFSVCFYSQYDCFNWDYLKDCEKVREGNWYWYCVPLFKDAFEEVDFLDLQNDDALADRIVDIIYNACESKDSAANVQ